MDERFDNLAKKRERKKRKREEKQESDEVEDGKVAKWQQEETGGSLQYIEKRIEDGNLGEVVSAIRDLNILPGEEVSTETEVLSADDICANSECGKANDVGTGKLDGVLEEDTRKDKRLLLISLHSCGNLVHHALKAFIATPEVKAVALIGTFPHPHSSHDLLTPQAAATT